jgi:hypothetical protein
LLQPSSAPLWVWLAARGIVPSLVCMHEAICVRAFVDFDQAVISAHVAACCVVCVCVAVVVVAAVISD